MNNSSISSVKLEQALLSLDQEAAEKIIKDSTEGDTPINIAANLVSRTLERIGEAWETGQVSLSQVYMGSMICEKIIDKVLPPKSPERKGDPKIAIAVVEDFHLLGKRIVYSTLRASGIELLDLGGGLSVEKVYNIVKSEKIEILLISVLMLPSALRIKELITKLKELDVKVIVGGAPFRFDKELWKEIGADYFGDDSAAALEIVNKLIEEKI